ARGRPGSGPPPAPAGVAAALAAAAFPCLRPPARTAVVAVAPTVGLSRIYVGAHLPLDVAGGAALGLMVDAAAALAANALRARRREPGRRTTPSPAKRGPWHSPEPAAGG